MVRQSLDNIISNVLTDFNEKKVITNFPVLVQYETVTFGVPSHDYDFEIFKIIRKLRD